MRPPRADTRVRLYRPRINPAFCAGLPGTPIPRPGRPSEARGHFRELDKTLPNGIKKVPLHAGQKTLVPPKYTIMAHRNLPGYGKRY
jgi:hypothetical protein